VSYDVERDWTTEHGLRAVVASECERLAFQIVSVCGRDA
jgi:hypothetical protein